MLDVLGDPLRRSVFEHLSRHRAAAGNLVHRLGAEYEEIRYRVSGLLSVDAITRTRDNHYGANPRAADAIRLNRGNSDARCDAGPLRARQ